MQGWTLFCLILTPFGGAIFKREIQGPGYSNLVNSLFSFSGKCQRDCAVSIYPSLAVSKHPFQKENFKLPKVYHQQHPKLSRELSPRQIQFNSRFHFYTRHWTRCNVATSGHTLNVFHLALQKNDVRATIISHTFLHPKGIY